MYKNNQGHLTVFCIVFVWLGGPPSPVRIITQVPWFMYQNRLGPSGGIYHPNFVPCFVVLYLNCSLCSPLSSIDTFLSTVVTKWSSCFKKTLMSQSVILITRYKSGTIIFWEKFFQKMLLSNHLWCPMMNKKNSSSFTRINKIELKWIHDTRFAQKVAWRESNHFYHMTL